MLLTIGSTMIMGYVASYSFLKSHGSPTNDASKIQRIFANAGWVGKEKGEIKTIRLRRKNKITDGMEYVYQLPLGFDRKKVDSTILEDGINVRQKSGVKLKDFKQVKLNKPIIKQIKKILNKKAARKEIELDFDGMLKIKVYNAPMPNEVKFDADRLKPNTWKILVGKSRQSFVYHDFEDRPHIIVAGATGFGKSQFLKFLITSLIEQQPDNVTFTLIDLKGGAAFQRFKDLKQVTRYAKNPEEAKEALKQAQEEMNGRYEDIVERQGFEDVKEAGIKKRHFVIIDEAADISSDATCMDIVTDIARRGRGAGDRLVYATQYPTNETLPSQVRQNIGARICFILETTAASKATLDEKGAEDLPEIPGRAIYKRVKQTVVQTIYITNKEVEQRIKVHIRPKGVPHEQSCTTPTADRKHPLITEKA
ncbi:FtsK/SpoIIIE domain-containing protein [Fictibacillus terranigra]|uniref:FtsK/SpoIIIE domain-containing protein n=1 Tax=Fictibacillus terranigra TaxID=3058424 RepID=A0ABT8E6X9_9BACL|nr:FtsK/SpoIIIE domain-containing protein [Fictibacillus sp. CENA-BCM004]MDN4073639.1 FtsK/SpoIIIE domain-containing protein [Fictibacillus sp. CENA-BCM004]